jgi:hypothetical protein
MYLYPPSFSDFIDRSVYALRRTAQNMDAVHVQRRTAVFKHRAEVKANLLERRSP